MKIEDLLDCSADELEQMTDEQLRAALEPYFKVTRPEFVSRPNANPNTAKQKQFNSKLDALKAAGLDLSFMKNFKHKKR